MMMYTLVHKLINFFLKRNPNPKEILLCNRGKLEATLIYLSTTSKSMKRIIELS
jgi:hypothetical protein